MTRNLIESTKLPSKHKVSMGQSAISLSALCCFLNIQVTNLAHTEAHRLLKAVFSSAASHLPLGSLRCLQFPQKLPIPTPSCSPPPRALRRGGNFQHHHLPLQSHWAQPGAAHMQSLRASHCTNRRAHTISLQSGRKPLFLHLLHPQSLTQRTDFKV